MDSGEIIQLRQEVIGKLDNLATAVQSLSDCVDEAESRVEQVEGRTEEATETLCTCLKQQRSLQQKLTDSCGSPGREETTYTSLEWQREKG